jgi:hypothetical protein
MWGLYAKSGTGICTQYKIEDIKNFLISGTCEPWTIKKVQYNDFIDEPKIFEDLINVVKSSKVNNPNEVNKYLQLFHLSKLMIWCAEKEWRFISPKSIYRIILIRIYQNVQYIHHMKQYEMVIIRNLGLTNLILLNQPELFLVGAVILKRITTINY